MPDFDVFSLNVNPDLKVKGKKEMTNVKGCAAQESKTSLNDFSTK